VKQENKLHCWPCLFSSNKHEGIFGFKSFVKRAEKSLTITNFYALLSTVKLFGEKKQKVETLLDSERKNDITRHNKQVEKSR